MKFLVPQGIGDSIWGVFKMPAIAKAHNDSKIDIEIGCWHVNEGECRAVDFLKRFSFVNSVSMKVMPHNGNEGPMLLPGPVADANGYYRYIPDGPNVVPGIDYVLVSNTPLERGIRLEDWLPQYETKWNIIDDFQFNFGELRKAEQFKKQYGEFVVFFMSSESGNGRAGHNRNGIWSPQQWIDLGTRMIEKYGVKILVVGAGYDASYYRNLVLPKIEQHKDKWIDRIGQFHIGETYAVVRQSKFIISYQSGIGIVANYFGVPTGIFWRQKGDSIDPNNYVSFEESMASAWANPKMISDGKHLPLIYGRHGVDQIMEQTELRNWI
jgi:hypothetical protein